ncbi:hypothetical protein H2198_009520 [Neophaeococcomyces mojaviensis]|uniref:Uncharacterized protein n=1 Tax=Neophaeococcomyces mojaviensis TaxID=3383035 RepID=A0ACC2ZU93_9EURO|nr:hypothetical protein H2198_009520 [Knufia sp. JES_112]
MRCSRTIPGPRYLTSTAVVLAELTKFLVSLTIYTFLRFKRPSDYQCLPEKWNLEESSQPLKGLIGEIARDLFGKRSSFALLLIPSVLYTITNNLQFIAASNLDAATYQVAYQAKLITTAAFAVMILRQKLSVLKWFSILTLAIGIAVISLPGSDDSSSTSNASKTEGNRNLGLLAVAVSCVLSGLAGVYFEFILKRHKSADEEDQAFTVMWRRNCQLSLGGFVLALGGAFLSQGSLIRENGFFYGYNSIVWATIGLQAFIGVVVALVIASADNILKGFATSLSVILSTIISVLFFDFIITRNFIYGTLLVLLSTHIYGLPETVFSGKKIEADSVVRATEYHEGEENSQDEVVEIGASIELRDEKEQDQQTDGESSVPLEEKPLLAGV